MRGASDLWERTRPDHWWGGAALGFLVVALADLLWMINRPGNALPSPAVTIGSFAGPAAVAITLSSAGMVISRRAGYRPWLSSTALCLSLGFVALCTLGAVLFVVAMLQGMEALSNF
ncbi:hypothetical protein NN3_15170 [Nocardia neocaledoniensis NBRC 108232]|uniref:Uncharacterized protein n=1 Tax=Nocardia neocaledoniensis TaxID=236511 RepID=A0A317NHW0_9NOCA|nr:hypothetical protein [Nocardia neocaledoniensis]PWV75016.1 hypothetical protein DFR69_10582 [Nocardia neocaledoniensis]GEM30510.1 hypothetical protein NN3_15170 [Nocardia neocaledoniensis NBRC 108232]